MRRTAWLGMVVLGLAFAGVGCPCVRGAVNASEGLRWWLFSSFGASKICHEMMKRGMPIKMPALGAPNSIGRFFPRQCNVQVNDAARTMAVTVAGDGYAFLPAIRRVGFSAGLSVEYRPDFRMEEDAVYVWGKFDRILAAPDLRLLGAENPAINLATKTAVGDLATAIGQAVLYSQIALGFTVVHRDDGDDFALGTLLPPEKPPRPFSPGKDHVMLATDVDELHASERDYLGPFAIDSGGEALFLRLRAAGAPLDYSVVDKAIGDAWMQSYERGAPIGPPPAPPVAYGVIPIGDTQRAVPLERGLYYVVVENKASAGIAALGVPSPFEPVGVLTYGVEVGDRP